MLQASSGWLYALQVQTMRRSALIAVVVGFALSAINQSDVLLKAPMTPFLALKLAMNFVVPFLVSSVSAVANRPRSSDHEDHTPSGGKG